MKWAAEICIHCHSCRQSCQIFYQGHYSSKQSSIPPTIQCYVSVAVSGGGFFFSMFDNLPQDSASTIIVFYIDWKWNISAVESARA